MGMKSLIFIVVSLIQSCVTSEQTLTIQQSDGILTIDGSELRVSELPPRFRMRIYEIEKERHEKLSEVSRQVVLDRMSTEVEQDNSPKETTEAELIAFYEEKRPFIPYSYEAIRPELKSLYLEESAKKRKSDQVAALVERHQIQFHVAAPSSPKFAFDFSKHPFLGSPSPDVVFEIVQFVDYTCPHCRQVEPRVQEILRQKGTQARVVAIDSPIHGPVSELYAKGAFCAHQLKQYDAYRMHMLSRNVTSQDMEFSAIWSSLGTTQESWQGCLLGEKASSYLEDTKKLVKEFGIQSTPRFFVNGELVPSIESIEAMIIGPRVAVR